MAKFLIDGTDENARNLIFDENTGIWAKHGWKYISAHIAFGIGIVGYLGFVIRAIFK